MRNKGLSNHEFLTRVREYLPSESGICETVCPGNSLEEIRFRHIEENTFYRFDSNALLAFTHTIEDHALEAANGSLITAMQDAKQFKSQRERYWQLAATIDSVQVIATGKLPPGKGRLKFCTDAKALVKNFWMVLYQGRKSRAMLLCEQLNQSKIFDEKEFVGFYTFNSRIISRAREDFAELLGGGSPELRQFAQLHKIDRAAKHLKIEFAREKKAMEIAIQKLQSHERYQPRHFFAELNKTLERLNRLQTHLPELIVGKND